jgi:hypothetical protein
MTRIVLALIFIALAAFSLPPILSADVLLIEEVRQAEKMELPVNGMKKSEVQARFGDPVDQNGAVGDPPISSWVYDRWTVYFEYDLVLFSVLHKGQVLEKKSG